MRIAIAGTGGFAREHIAALRRIDGIEIAYVVGRNRDIARDVAALAPGAIGTDDRAAVLGDRSVEAVDICNATPDHASWAIDAGRAGKHVHVDKPPALNLRDFDAMVEATAGTSIMVGQTVRFQPSIAAAHQAIVDRSIGTVRLAHLSWYTGHVWPGGWRSWQLDPDKSGGHPVHNGVHGLDAALWLVGSEPVRVFAREFASFAEGMPVKDSFHILVQFVSGALLTLELSYALRVAGDSYRRLMLAGTAGTITHTTADDPGLSTPSGAQPPVSVEGALEAQLRHWINAVRGNEPFIVHPRESRAVLATALAAQESLRVGRPITIGDVA